MKGNPKYLTILGAVLFLVPTVIRNIIYSILGVMMKTSGTTAVPNLLSGAIQYCTGLLAMAGLVMLIVAAAKYHYKPAKIVLITLAVLAIVGLIIIISFAVLMGSLAVMSCAACYDVM